MYYFIYYVLRYRKKVVFKNLHNSFPNKSEKEIIKIAKDFYSHFCDLMIETIKLFSLSEKEQKKRVKYPNIEVINKFHENNQNILVVCGHYGNWEVTTQIGLFTKFFPLPIYKPMNSKYFNNYFIKHRSKYIAEPVAMNNILRRIIHYKKEGKLTLSAFLADQRPMKSEIQYWTTFLNQETPVYLGIEKIAKKFNSPIVYLTMEKPKRGYYNIIFDILCSEPKNTKEFELTEMHTKRLEKDILTKPELWLWSHNRWKHKREFLNDKNK